MSRNLTDPQAIARYLIQRFSDLEMGATGALLIGDGDAPLGILILEVRPDANVDALDTILDGATTQVVPFLYKPGLAPTLTDEEVDLFCELVESPLVDIAVSDCLCVWSTGHYLARSNHGRLACLDDFEGGEL